MSVEPSNASISEQLAEDTRKAWAPPVIEDADIGAITNGGGDSGIEGTPFLKTGS